MGLPGRVVRAEMPGLSSRSPKSGGAMRVIDVDFWGHCCKGNLALGRN
jgi:hypothetical protein